jgi:hypothetical protein
MKTRRQDGRPPRDLPNSDARRAPQDNLEQAIIGADIEPSVGFDDQRAAIAADSGIDDAQQHGSGRKPLAIGGEQIGRRLGFAGRQVGKQRDHRDRRRGLLQYRGDLAGIGPLQTEIGEQHNHRFDYAAPGSGAATEPRGNSNCPITMLIG